LSWRLKTCSLFHKAGLSSDRVSSGVVLNCVLEFLFMGTKEFQKPKEIQTPEESRVVKRLDNSDCDRTA
jgi:hypothetical protein